MSDLTEPLVITRRAMSTVTRGLSMGIAVILALVALWFWQLPADRIDGATRLGFVVIPILLAFVLGGGTVVDVIRGRQRLLEADHTGIWVRGMPRLAWSDIADVRTEEIVSFNSLQTRSGSSVNLAGWEIELGKGGVIPLQAAVNNGEVSVRQRLGIVPRDESLVPDPGALSGVSAYVERKSAETADRIGREPIERAPFGLYETEMDAFFEDVVAGIRRFHEVGALSDLEGISRPPGS